MTYISALECGKRSIALEYLKIAVALEISVYLLFANNPDDNESNIK